MQRIALSARHPFGGARAALGVVVPRHLRKEFLAEALLRERLVEDHRTQQREGAQGRTNRARVLPPLLFERVVGLAFHLRHELRQHHHDVVNTVALPEETREDGPAHGLFPLAQPMGGRLSDLVEERSLVVVAQPREVKCKNARLLSASEFTTCGASTTDVMLAGKWKTLRMVAYYSAGAIAERGAVARYL